MLGTILGAGDKQVNKENVVGMNLNLGLSLLAFYFPQFSCSVSSHSSRQHETLTSNFSTK